MAVGGFRPPRLNRIIVSFLNLNLGYLLSYIGHYNFLIVAPMVIILVFLKSQCREVFKSVYFLPPSDL